MEALLFFLVFFLPGYLQQTVQFDIGLMFSPIFHLNTLIFTLPQILLMLYVLNLRSPGGLGDLGFGNLRVSVLFPALLTFLLLFGITTGLGLFAEILGRFSSMDLRNPALPDAMPEGFSIFQPPYLPLLILFTSVVIAYFEELFFRVYLVGQFSDSPRGSHIAILVSSLLFAGGHLYQGLIGGVGTFFIGILLGYRYLRCRNWHEIAIAHALYNFAVILLIPL